MAGDTAKAKTTYQDFLTLWKDADPDIPFSPSSPKKQLALVPVDSPQNSKLLDLQRPVQEFVRFTRDGKAVIYASPDQDADNLWLQPLDGSPGKQITNFKSERIGDFQWSFDGKQLGLIRGHTDSDVVLLQESKQ